MRYFLQQSLAFALTVAEVLTWPFFRVSWYKSYLILIMLRRMVAQIA